MKATLIRQSLLATLIVAGAAIAAKHLPSDSKPCASGPGSCESGPATLTCPVSSGADCCAESAPEKPALASLTSFASFPAVPEADEKAETKPEGEKAKEEVKLDPSLGIIEGRITLKGEAPKLDAAQVSVPDGHADHAKCAAHVVDERLIVAEDGGVANSVVYVADEGAPTRPGQDYRVKGAKRPEPRKVVLDNENCLFQPHIIATTIGSEIEVTNSDDFIHNTRGLLAASGINIAIPPKGKLPPKKLRKAGWGVYKCDFHSWMTSHVHIFEHDLFDLSEKDGSFRIVNVPPGKYSLRIWHEVLKNTLVEVEVTAGKTTKVEVGLEKQS